MKLRVRFTKVGRVRFLSHRDLARIWERALRRARLPIAYSEGFSPRPRLHFGLASSVGHESLAEYLEIDLREPVPLEGLATTLSACLPEGLEVTAVAEVDGRSESLQAAIGEVSWQFVVDLPAADCGERIDRLMAADRLPIIIERKGEQVEADLRPAVLRLEVESAHDGGGSGSILWCDLATRPRSFRPSEVLGALDLHQTGHLVRRIEQWIIDDGDRRPPLPSPSVSPPVQRVG